MIIYAKWTQYMEVQGRVVGRQLVHHPPLPLKQKLETEIDFTPPSPFPKMSLLCKLMKPIGKNLIWYHDFFSYYEKGVSGL